MVDVVVLGRTVVTGKDARIVDTCAHHDPGPRRDRDHDLDDDYDEGPGRD